MDEQTFFSSEVENVKFLLDSRLESSHWIVSRYDSHLVTDFLAVLLEVGMSSN